MLNNDDLNRKKEAFEKNYHAFEAEKFYKFRRPWLIRAAVSSTILAMALGIGWLVDHAINLNKLNEANSRYSALEERTSDYDKIKSELAVLKEANVDLQQLKLDYARLSEAHKSLEARLSTSSEQTKRLVAFDSVFKEKLDKYVSIINKQIFLEDYSEFESNAKRLDILWAESLGSFNGFSDLPSAGVDLLLGSIKKTSELYKEISRRIKTGAGSATELLSAKEALEKEKKEFLDYKKKAESEASDLKAKYNAEQKKAVEALAEIENQKVRVADLEKRLKDVEKARDDAVQGLKAYKGTHSHTDAEYSSMEPDIASLREKASSLQGQLDSLTTEYHRMLFNGCTRVPKKDGVRYIYFHIDYYTQRDPPKMKEMGGEWDFETCQKLEIFKQLVPENIRNEYNHKAKSSGFRFARVEAESAEGQGDKYYLSLVFSNSRDNVQTRVEYLSIIDFIKNSIMNK